MSAKKKQEVWLFCESCGRYIYNRQFDEHTVLCDPKCNGAKEPFIQHDIFHATAVETTSKMLTESKFPAPSSNKDVLLISVHSMKRCGIAIGATVIVSSNHNKDICKAWPSSCVTPDCIALPSITLKNCKVSPGQFVYIQKLTQLCSYATKVEIQLCQPVEFELNKIFTDYCLHYLDGNFILEGNTYELLYYGKPRQFQVLHITNKDINSYSKQMDQGSKNIGIARYLCQEFEKLDVQEKTDIAQGICHKSGNKTTDNGAPENHQFFGNGFNQNDLIYNYVSAMETNLVIHPFGSVIKKDSEAKKGVSFQSIGGLKTQIQAVREMIEMPLTNPELFTAYGKEIRTFYQEVIIRK